MPTAFERYAQIPKYIQLAEELRAQIRRRTLKPGVQLPSFVEMQRRHGVSQAVLDRAYALLEQENLIVRRSGSGTFVAETPKASDTRTHIIGLSGESFGAARTSPYMARVYEGLFSTAEKAGYDLLHVGRRSRNHWEKLDGLLVMWGRNSLRDLRLPIMPTVSLFSTNEGAAGVTFDAYMGVRQLMEHLVGLGHRRIARLYKATEASPMAQDSSEQAAAAYKDVLHEAGVRSKSAWQRRMPDGLWDEREFMRLGHEVMTSWIQDNGHTGWRTLGCTALVAQNDATAVGAIKALQEAGLRVPGDVSVTGFDGDEVAQMFQPALTTVEVPLFEIGAHAIEMLLRQIDGNSTEPAANAEHEILPTMLRLGETTGPAPRS